MNWNVMLQVVMSAVFFAPLLVIFGAFLFVGVLVAFEGMVALVRKTAIAEGAAPAAVNPEVGTIVAGLKGAIAEEGQRANASPEKTPGSKANLG